MGSGGSKPESNPELAMGHRIDQIKKLKISTPSSKELHVDGAVVKEDEISFSSSKRVLESDESEKGLKMGRESDNADKEESDKEDGREIGSRDGPGSPSFSVYNFNSVPHSGDIRALSKEKEGKHSTLVHGRTDSMDSSQGLRSKATKKDKGGRFQGLKKGPAYSCMNIPSCYRPPCDSPRVVGKSV
ncbi:uncharacterized protein LOC131238648 [Magnolia sinica]|uniref:uncharacterized protein LOC131238648 n=1 Tax=Magnolia sinica TaxID=86752 RepID=UPI00265A3DB7|nr:uncharacterized protein LOC131238648 [Magnolia sinica]